MKREYPLVMILIFILATSCATTKKPGSRASVDDTSRKATRETESARQSPGVKNGAAPARSDEDVLRERFAGLVRETDAGLRKGEPGPDPEKFREFYETPLEKDAMYFLARTYESVGNMEKALETFELLDARYPGTQDATEGLSRVLLELASRSLVERRAKAAKKYLNLARAKNGEGDAYLYNRAIASLLEGNRDEGIGLLNGTSPGFKESVLYRLLTGQLSGGDVEVQSGLKELPRKEKSAILNYNAVIALEKGDLDKAERLLKRVEEEKLVIAETPTILGNVLFENGRFKEAAEQYKRGIEANPSIPENYLNLGIVSDIFLEDFSLASSCYASYIELGGIKSEEVSKWLTNLELKERAR